MMEQTRVRKNHPMLGYEIHAYQEYLEKMAAKGLLVQAISGNTFYFRKTEPKNVRFYVDVFEKASWFDSRAEEETLDYKEYCEGAGWNYVCTNGKFQVFYSEEEHPVPIETDLNKRLRMILMGTLYPSVIQPLMAILLMLMIMGLQMRDIMRNPNEIIEMPMSSLMVLVLWGFIGFSACLELIDTVRFWLRNKIPIYRKNAMAFRTLRQVERYIRRKRIEKALVIVISVGMLLQVNVVVSVVFLAVLILIVLAVSFWGYFMDRKRELHSRRFNRNVAILSGIIGGVIAIVSVNVIILYVVLNSFDDHTVKYEYKDEQGQKVTWYVSQDELPYTLEDAGYHIRGDGYRDSDKEVYNELLCTEYTYSDMYYTDPEADEALYSIYYEKMQFKGAKWCRRWVENSRNEKNNVMEEHAELAKDWEADTVYVKSYEYGDQELIVVYDDYCYVLSMNLNKPEEIRKFL